MVEIPMAVLILLAVASVPTALFLLLLLFVGVSALIDAILDSKT